MTAASRANVRKGCSKKNGVLPAQRKVEEDDLPLSEVDREAFEDPLAGEQLGQSTLTDKTKNDASMKTDNMTDLEMTNSYMGLTGKQIKATVPKLGLSKGSRVVKKGRHMKRAAGERKKNLDKMRNWAATGRMTGSNLDL